MTLDKYANDDTGTAKKHNKLVWQMCK